MALDEKILEKIEALQEKYDASGQDMLSYLEGLLYADYLTYWDYINLDILLQLQQPRTPIPDENIFIIYHQITELYFKLCLLEIDQINPDSFTDSELGMRVARMNAYFENMVRSFAIMVDGMDPKQFLQFRMALLPASGFQSAQYRKIEICSTSLFLLMEQSTRNESGAKESLKNQFQHIYWRKGATELKSGKKTLTLTQFEQKYDKELLELAEKMQNRNLNFLLEKLNGEVSTHTVSVLRKFDEQVNIHWPLVHYKSAVRYLQKNPADIAATGGTNWQKYLPPRFQKRIFFPTLWSQTEQDNWGKVWVDEQLEQLLRTKQS